MIVVRAPVRISFGGGGTDLEAYYARFGGFVVSAAITRYCYVAVGDAAGGTIRLTSADYGLWESHRQLPPVEEPLVLPKAAIEWAASRSGGSRLRKKGLHLFLASDVPPGTGLGSSSAMAVALVQALSCRAGLAMEPGQVAEAASRLEIERLGMPIGKQDQYASAFGGINALTFSRGGVCVEPLDLSPGCRAALGRRLLLFSTGRSRHSASILRQQSSDTAAKPDVTASLHRMKELAHQMRAALETGDLESFAHLLHLGWQYKKQISRRISSADIDRWYAAARDAGALGGKITGAGGGGYLLLYCPPESQEDVRAVMARFGLPELSFALEPSGVQILSTEPRSAARTDELSLAGLVGASGHA